MDLNSPETQEKKCVCVERERENYYKESAHMIIEAGKSKPAM